MALKDFQKSLILSTLVVVVNFIAYLTYRLFFFKEISLFESLGFTVWVSVLDFTIVFGVSFLLFKAFKK